MSKEREIFLSKPLVDGAMGSYKGEVFRYIAEEDCIVTSGKGSELYRKDLAINARIIVATDKHFVFVKDHLLPDTIECFPDQGHGLKNY